VSSKYRHLFLWIAVDHIGQYVYNKIDQGGQRSGIMNEAFLKLDLDKQEKILNACFKAFSKHSYKLTSTNEIIEAAGISKGMLFYYFKNKKQLFHSLIDLAISFSEEKFYEQDFSERDFITRISRLTKQKAEIMQQFPDMSSFLTRVFTQELELLTEDEVKRFEQLKVDAMEVYYKGIDTTLFRDDLDINTIMIMINDAITGYEERMKLRITDEMIQNNNYDVLFEDFEQYLNNLRKIYYKEVTSHD